MKLAILITGNLRTFDITKNNILSNLNGLGISYDLYLYTYYQRWNYHPWIRSQLGYLGEETLSEEQISIFLEGVNYRYLCISNQDEVNVEISNVYSKSFHPKIEGKFQDLFSQFLGIKQTLDKMNGYTHVLKLRFDTYFTSQIVLKDLIEIDKKSILSDNIQSFSDHVLFGEYDTIYELTEYYLNSFINGRMESTHQTLGNFYTDNKIVNIDSFQVVVIRKAF